MKKESEPRSVRPARRWRAANAGIAVVFSCIPMLAAGWLLLSNPGSLRVAVSATAAMLLMGIIPAACGWYGFHRAEPSLSQGLTVLVLLVVIYLVTVPSWLLIMLVPVASELLRSWRCARPAQEVACR